MYGGCVWGVVFSNRDEQRTEEVGLIIWSITLPVILVIIRTSELRESYRDVRCGLRPHLCSESGYVTQVRSFSVFRTLRGAVWSHDKAGLVQFVHNGVFFCQ